MKLRRHTTVIAALIVGSALVFTAQAAPPEGKGQGQSAGQSGQNGNSNKGGNKGNGNKGGNPGKGNSSGGNNGGPYKSLGTHGDNNGSNGNPNHKVLRTDNFNHYDDDRRYDDRGRYYDYFDDHRDRHGRYDDGDALTDLVYAGITAALAREYALDYGFGGYSSLPPGIRKNLARGKPLPPGIAKKMVPGSLLGRLPRHSGYEWRIAGSDLILIAIGTMVVADILYDVFD